MKLQVPNASEMQFPQLPIKSLRVVGAEYLARSGPKDREVRNVNKRKKNDPQFINTETYWSLSQLSGCCAEQDECSSLLRWGSSFNKKKNVFMAADQVISL